MLDDLETRSPIVQCIVRKEVGRAITRNGIYYEAYNPYMPGAQQEVGTAQLHPRGLLNDFYRRGFTNPYNPSESHTYLQLAIDSGLSSHWPTARGC